MDIFGHLSFEFQIFFNVLQVFEKRKFQIKDLKKKLLLARRQNQKHCNMIPDLVHLWRSMNFKTDTP